MLHLVRHARPRLTPEAPAAAWRLADAREVAPLRESGRLPQSARWYTSAEPKARATAAALTEDTVPIVPELGEQRRDATWFATTHEFLVVVRRAFDRPNQRAVPGWEPLAATRDRVVPAVLRFVGDTDDDVVLVGHGTAWTVLVAELTGAAPDLVAWEAMGMPDHCVLDVRRRQVVRQWWGRQTPAE